MSMTCNEHQRSSRIQIKYIRKLAFSLSLGISRSFRLKNEAGLMRKEMGIHFPYII